MSEIIEHDEVLEAELTEDLTDREELFLRSVMSYPGRSKGRLWQELSGNASYGAARDAAYRIMKKPAAKQFLAHLKKERNARLSVDADWLLEKLVEMACADKADLYNEDGTLKAPHEWPEVFRMLLVEEITSKELFEFTPDGKIPIGVEHKVKLAKITPIMKLIGDHVAVSAFAKNVNHNHRHDMSAKLREGLERAKAARIAAR